MKFLGCAALLAALAYLLVTDASAEQISFDSAATWQDWTLPIGAVEIDDVQAGEWMRSEFRGQRARVFAVHRGRVVAPLGKSHAATLEQVDGGNEFEAGDAGLAF